MKIATITCHDVYNYGASLQAYALQEYCKHMGCEYEIINYRSSNYGLKKYFLSINNRRFNKPFLRELYILLKLPSRVHGLRRKYNFDRFTQKYLQCTETQYYTNDELKNGDIEADLFIAGSDQIWNTILNNGRDKSYYLNFALNIRGRKISYAGSFGTDRIYNGAESLVKQELANFDSISVRESCAARMIEQFGYKVDRIVCDPVFLLNKEDWYKFITNIPISIPSKEYIVVYDCENSQQLKNAAQELKRKFKLPIYSLSKSSDTYADKRFSSSGPIEFVRIINQAKIVVTNSFHALAFSIIFKKDFIIINRVIENNNIRMSDFLNYLNLSNRLVNSIEEFEYLGIDWKSVNNLIERLIISSKQYLSLQISLSKESI